MRYCLHVFIENKWPNSFFLINAWTLVSSTIKCEGIIWRVSWGWRDWWGYKWNKISLELIIVETGRLVHGDFLNVLSTFICFEIFHDKRVKMKMTLHTGGLKLLYPVPNLEALWPASLCLQPYLALDPILSLHSLTPPILLNQNLTLCPLRTDEELQRPKSQIGGSPWFWVLSLTLLPAADGAGPGLWKSSLALSTKG